MVDSVRLLRDANHIDVQALTPGVAESLTSGGSSTAATEDSVYRVGAVLDTYYQVTDSAVTVSSSNGNYIGAGAYEYLHVPNGYWVEVDTSGSLMVSKCS